MAGRRAWRRWGGWALALALAFWVLSAPGEHGTLTDDERDYAQAAIHLLRDGVFTAGDKIQYAVLREAL